MQKLVRNTWRRESGEPYARAQILNHETHPEGLDIDRVRFLEAGRLTPNTGVGHIISVLRGRGSLHVADGDVQSYLIEAGVHIYLPPGLESVLDGEEGTELVRVSGASAAQAQGRRMLLRDEVFVAACASGNQSLRWILTPQYLSRRVFLHHDPVLLSKSGNPVSWFRTTMFDVAGLPHNQDGEPVFKMSYNSRTECNVCYDVQGAARVRMARHPYAAADQRWSPWHALDGDSTYHLNEAAGSAEEERHVDETSGTARFLRNKHEVHIAGGHVTLCCLFDPAPTGFERHRPGEYSDYEPLSQVVGTKAYDAYRQELIRYDEMVDRLSLAKATGALGEFQGTGVWELFLQGREAQGAIEARLADALAVEGKGRERVLAPWMQTVTA